MKYILVIFLSMSLYSPDIARLIAYADLVVDVVSEKKVNICDCEGILQEQDHPTDHQEYMAVVKTEFKYVATPAMVIPVAEKPVLQHYAKPVTYLLTYTPFDIFQPPRV